MKKGRTVAALALGCAKNRVDTEEILGLLGREGYIFTPYPAEADIAIVNTCAFIEAAQQESIDKILELAGRRKGKTPLIIAAGCLPQRYGERLLKAIPQLDGIIGVHSYAQLPSFLERCLNGKREALLLKPPAGYRSLGPRLLTGAPHSAYVKIAEGCSNHCRYCLIPSLRGPLHSRPAAEIITEIKQLIAGGAGEINLVAQDTTAYGSEWGSSDGLAALIRQILQSIPVYFWLRILYAHPARITDSLIELIAGEERICNYLDLPLQHINSALLKSMDRRYTKEGIVNLVGKLRQRIPGVTLRTTYLVGYPGENGSHFRELCAFLRQEPFERVGVFAYSRQQGTSAAYLQNQVPRRIAEKRRRKLLRIQQDIALGFNRSLIGKNFTVLVDGPAGGGSKFYRGRTSFQAPEVDGALYFRSSRRLQRGSLATVRINSASPYDLLGTAISKQENTNT